jgi:hypothetical protein
MTDKELLELAAKAAGITEPWSTNTLAAFQYDAKHWNPLTDDGDALRLAVKLDLDVCTDHNDEEWHVNVWAKQKGVLGQSELRDENVDPYAATRRAIVRAAAEIGKQKE